MEDQITKAMWDQYPTLAKDQKLRAEKRAESENLQQQVAASLAEGQHKQNMRESVQNARKQRREARRVTLPKELNPTGAEVVVVHPDKFTTCYIVRTKVEGVPYGPEETADTEEASPDSEPVQADTTSKRNKKR